MVRHNRRLPRLAALLIGAGLAVPLVTAPAGDDVVAQVPDPAAYAVTPAVSPFVQSGPRNIITRVQDTYVTNVNSADHSGEQLLHVGTPDNGTTKYRSFLKFDVSKLRGADIKSASLRLYNSYTGSCDGWWMYADAVSAAWSQSTITWANQPAPSAGYQSAANFGLGQAACPDQPVDSDPDTSNAVKRLDVTAMVKAWTNGTLANNGLRLSAGESGSVAYKELCSMNPTATDPACHLAYYAPTLEVEFNPGAPVIAAADEYAVNYGGYPATGRACRSRRSPTRTTPSRTPTATCSAPPSPAGRSTGCAPPARTRRPDSAVSRSWSSVTGRAASSPSSRTRRSRGRASRSTSAPTTSPTCTVWSSCRTAPSPSPCPRPAR